MSSRTSPWPVGVPCWADLTVGDVDAAKAFYSAVLGWSFDDPDDDNGGYTIARVGDGAVAGVGSSDGRPAEWTLYFAVDDADATAAAVTRHGGTVVLGPLDVGSQGRMFTAADPTGASFGVWQAGRFIGAEAVNEPGALVWEDLRSPDPDAARTFYQQLFGYSTAPVEMASPEYTTFALAGEAAPLGGIGGMFGMNEARPHWLLYFAVTDLDEATTAAERAGGQVLQRGMESPYGRMSVLSDPAGASFIAMQPPDDMPRPDRSG